MDYISPRVELIDIQMQEIIAASLDTTFTIGDYTPGYTEEENF